MAGLFGSILNDATSILGPVNDRSAADARTIDLFRIGREEEKQESKINKTNEQATSNRQQRESKFNDQNLIGHIGMVANQGNVSS